MQKYNYCCIFILKGIGAYFTTIFAKVLPLTNKATKNEMGWKAPMVYFSNRKCLKMEFVHSTVVDNKDLLVEANNLLV